MGVFILKKFLLILLIFSVIQIGFLGSLSANPDNFISVHAQDDDSGDGGDNGGGNGGDEGSQEQNAQDYSETVQSFNDTMSSSIQSIIDAIVSAIMDVINQYTEMLNTSQGTDIGDSDLSSSGEITGGSTVTEAFSSLIESIISAEFGLGTEGGTITDPNNPAPLSNLNHTVDSGVVASYNTPDPGSPVNISGEAPVLSATTYCPGPYPVIRLTWAGTPLVGASGGPGSTWQLLKSGVPGVFSILPTYIYDITDADVAPNSVYYYRVFGYNGGAHRTPLSNVIAIYASDCSVQGYVFKDDNRDQIFDNEGSEGALTNELVHVLNNSTGGIAASGRTDNNGRYYIVGIPSGSYTIRHIPNATITHWGRSTPNDKVINTNVARVASFGLYDPSEPPPPPCPRGTISGFVYNDLNRNQSYHTGEEPVFPNELVQALNNSTGAVTAAVTTDSNGRYVLSGLPTGGYTIRHQPSTTLATWSRSNPNDFVVSFVTDRRCQYIPFGLYNPSTPPPPPSTPPSTTTPTPPTPPSIPTPPPPPPSINLRLRNNVQTINNDRTQYDFPYLTAEPGDSVSLSWDVRNSTVCHASSNPSQSAWNHTINIDPTRPFGDTFINTTSLGTNTFTLACRNDADGSFPTQSINLTVEPRLKPYFQTTGGDIHTNETINITGN